MTRMSIGVLTNANRALEIDRSILQSIPLGGTKGIRINDWIVKY